MQLLGTYRVEDKSTIPRSSTCSGCHRWASLTIRIKFQVSCGPLTQKTVWAWGQKNCGQTEMREKGQQTYDFRNLDSK